MTENVPEAVAVDRPEVCASLYTFRPGEPRNDSKVALRMIRIARIKGDECHHGVLIVNAILLLVTLCTIPYTSFLLYPPGPLTIQGSYILLSPSFIYPILPYIALTSRILAFALSIKPFLILPYPGLYKPISSPWHPISTSPPTTSVVLPQRQSDSMTKSPNGHMALAFLDTLRPRPGQTGLGA